MTEQTAPTVTPPMVPYDDIRTLVTSDGSAAFGALGRSNAYAIAVAVGAASNYASAQRSLVAEDHRSISLHAMAYNDIATILGRADGSLDAAAARLNLDAATSDKVEALLAALDRHAYYIILSAMASGVAGREITPVELLREDLGKVLWMDEGMSREIYDRLNIASDGARSLWVQL